jgi:transcriptional regulator with XRE-family HTH domain
VAAVIRQRREQAGLSLNQLAERTRLSRQMLSFVESGRRMPTMTRRRRGLTSRGGP